MRTTNCLFPILAILVSCNAPMMPVEKYGGLSGNIQSVKTSTYEAKLDLWHFSSTKGALYGITEEEYDPDGHLVKKIEYDKKGEIKEQIVYGYKGDAQISEVTTDDKNNVIKEMTYFKRKGKDQIWKITEKGETYYLIMNYDPKERVSTVFYDNYIPFRSNKYDENGRTIAVLNLEGTKIVSETRYEYDERGNLTEAHAKKNGDETILSFDNSEMDIYGNYTKTIIYQNDLPVSYKELEITYR